MLQNHAWKIEVNGETVKVYEHANEKPVLETTVKKFAALKGLIEHVEQLPQS